VPNGSWKQAAPTGFALAIVLFGIAFSIPIWLHTGEVSLGADIQYYVPWSENFSRQFWSGELYPRWLESMNGGLGSPTLFFCPPFPLYMSALWYPLTVISGSPWFAVAAAATTAMVASGFSAFVWLRSFATPRASLIAAIFYMAIPYHLGADLYARFAYCEFWGFVWMPLVLRASRPDQAGASTLPSAVIRTCVGVAIPYGLLCVTHLPTLLLFSAVPALQAIVLPTPERRLGHVLGVFSGMFLGFAMAGAYVVPAWGDRAYISMVEVHTTGVSFYAHNFLIDATRDVLDSSIDWFERGLDLWICLVLAFAVYAAMFLRRLERKPNREAWFWILVTLSSVLVTTRIAEPVWRYMPVIKIVEFPWRFGTVSTVAVTALAALVLGRAQARGTSTRALVSEYVGSWKAATFLTLSMLAFFWAVFAYTSNIYRYPIPGFVASIVALAFVYCIAYGFGFRFDRSEHRSVLGTWLIASFLILANIPHVIPQVAWHLETLRKGSHSPDPAASEMRQQVALAFDAWEYRIHTVQSENFNQNHISRLRNSLRPVTLVVGIGKVSVVDHSARRSTFDIEAATPVTILLRRYFYPGTAFLDSSGQPLGTVTPSAGEGLVLAELPAGTYRAQLVLNRGTNEKLGLWVSFVSIALCVALALYVYAYRGASK
jgi:hypothetical protein